MASLAQAERAQLCDLLDELGPRAPTLCEGWLTHDLAAHMVARETQPLALPGIVVPQVHPLTALFERRYRRIRYPELVRRLRSGPPLGPFQLPGADARFNLAEFFIHHEDVRRPAGLGPRRLSAAMQRALWRRIPVLAPRFTRRLDGVGLELRVTGHDPLEVRSGDPRVVIEGSAGEVFLWLWNRKVARVRLRGPIAAVEAARRTQMGE